MRRDMDPDAFIREQVFQRLVDATGVDPEPLCRHLYRMSIIGVTLPMLWLWARFVPVALQAGLNPYAPGLMLVLVWFNLAIIGRAIHLPPAMSLHPLAAVQRVMFMASSVLTTCMGILAVTYTAAQMETPVKLAVLCICLAWPMSVCSLYLHLCRRPPPKRPRTTGAPSRTASAGI